MKQRSNPKQLVLRRDRATGLTLVGWEEDLPVGRFEHLWLIGEPGQPVLPGNNDTHYDAYQQALQQAREANHILLSQQIQRYKARGWYQVPFTLATNPAAMLPDQFGIFTASAMQLLYQLTQNQKNVWAIIKQESVIHVRARYPRRELDTLTYQVWFNRQKQQLAQIDGCVLEGQLLVSESGLWLQAK